MVLSGADIKKVLEGVESTPPSSGSGGGAIISKISDVSSKVIPFSRPSPDQMSLDDIFAQLNDMTLPQTILDRAQPIFNKTGFVVETAKVYAQYDLKTARPYTAATRGDIRLALLHVPPQVFDNPNVWGSFAVAIENIEGWVRFVAQDRNDSSPGFNGFVKTSQQRGKKWNFVSWNWVIGFLEERDTIEQVFELPDVGNGPAKLLRLSDLTQEDRKKIIEILAVQAGALGALSSKQILENFIVAATWPDKFRTMINWVNLAESDAQSVVKLAIDKNQFDPGDGKYGDTYLGALLASVLRDLGFPDNRKLAELILRYNLVGRANSLADVKKYL